MGEPVEIRRRVIEDLQQVAMGRAHGTSAAATTAERRSLPSAQRLQNLAARTAARFEADLALDFLQGVAGFLADLAVRLADIVAAGGQEALQFAALDAGERRVVGRPRRPDAGLALEA